MPLDHHPCAASICGIAPEFADEAEYYTLQNALSWRRDPTTAGEIEVRLSSYGFDQHAINVEVHAQARELIILFEGLLNAAQTKRVLLLRKSGSSTISVVASRVPQGSVRD